MAWRPTRVNASSIWQVSIFSYRRGSNEWHGYRVFSHGRLVAKRTGFADQEAAENALVTLSLLLSQWRRQRNIRKRVARGDQKKGGARCAF